MTRVRAALLAAVLCGSTAAVPARAATEHGGVWAWGAGASGRLGDGAWVDAFDPVRVLVPSEPAALSAGFAHGLAIDHEDRIWSWGNNDWGQLGDGNAPVANATPDPIPYPTATSVSAGFLHSVALDTFGDVWTWGNNDWGQLGTGDCLSRNLPARVGGMPPVQAISAGYLFTIALDVNGGVWAWGDDLHGQLGDGAVTPPACGSAGSSMSPVPVPVSGLSGVVAISAGRDHALALRSNGTVWSWGWNEQGRLGRTTPTQDADVPGSTGLTSITAVSAGERHSLALASDGTVWAWGRNTEGQLGDGTTLTRNAPVPVPSAAGARAVHAGAEHSVALRADGRVWGWGTNDLGQLGAAAPALSTTATAVAGVRGALMLGSGWASSHTFAAIPSLAITRPADGTWSATGPEIAGSGPVGERVQVDGRTTVVGQDGSWSIAATGWSEGTHTVRAHLLDDAGAVIASTDPVTFHVDSTPPSAAFAQPGGGIWAQGTHVAVPGVSVVAGPIEVAVVARDDESGVLAEMTFQERDPAGRWGLPFAPQRVEAHPDGSMRYAYTFERSQAGSWQVRAVVRNRAGGTRSADASFSYVP